MMKAPKRSTLSHYTKAVVFLITVVSTEMGSNLGLYLAMGVWLELTEIVVLEQRLIKWFKR